MAKTSDWIPLAQQFASSAGIPPALLLAEIEQESGGDASSHRIEVKLNDSSIGLFQLLYATAQGMGYTGEIGNPDTLTGLFDPEINFTYGTKFLKGLWAKYNGDVARIASEYNGGDRPSLGFGTPATSGGTVCLEHDENTGECKHYFTYVAGQFGNQGYVDGVLAAYARWQNTLATLGAAPASTSAPAAPDLSASTSDAGTFQPVAGTADTTQPSIDEEDLAPMKLPDSPVIAMTAICATLVALILWKIFSQH